MTEFALASPDDGTVDDDDQSIVGLQCTDEILSPIHNGNNNSGLSEEVDGLTETGNEDISEFGDFQVLDECVDDEETGDAVHEAKNSEDAQFVSATPDAKSSTATKPAESAKRKFGSGEGSKSPAKIPKPDLVTRRSRSPANNSGRRDQIRRRYDHSRSRSNSRSRRRRSRSRSRSRHCRRRSRSRSGRRQSRSPMRSPRKKTLEKKTEKSSDPKKVAEKITDEGTKISDQKKSGDLSNVNETKSDAQGIMGQQQKMVDTKTAKVEQSKQKSEMTDEAESGSIDRTNTAKQQSISNETSIATDVCDTSMEEATGQTNQSNCFETIPPTGKLSIFVDAATLNDSKEGTTSCDSRVNSSAYDGDILEIAVTDDTSFDDMSHLTTAMHVTTFTKTAAVPAISVTSSQPASSAGDKQHPVAAKEVNTSIKGAVEEPKPTQTKKSLKLSSTSKELHSGQSSSRSSLPRSSDQKSMEKRPVDKNCQKSKESKTTPPKRKTSEEEKEKTLTFSAPAKNSVTKPKVDKQSAAAASVTSKGSNAKSNGKSVAVALPSPKMEQEPLPLSSLPPRRRELVPEVKVYVDSIRNLEFDVKVYCCFYCVACPLLLPTTPRYEEHLNAADHKKNVVRWRICQDLLSEDLKPRANRQLDVDNFTETIVGADQVIEVCDNNETPCNFVCVMCSSFHADVDALLSHLTSFLHIENYMEKQCNDVFSPPDVSVSEFESATISKRQSDPHHVANVFSAARTHMMRHGRGSMRSYVGDKYHDMTCSVVTEMEEMEETVMMSLMEQLFSGDGSYKIKWDRVAASKSLGNQTYHRQSKETQEKIVGLQTIVEIWFPNRRMPPVYYCTSCNYMVTDIVAHCITNKHWIEYLNKCYKPILECLLLEADDANSMKDSLVTAVKLVLDMEGANGRIENVIQLLSDTGVIFCAVNAQIAKQIVNEMGMKVTVPKADSPRKPAAGKFSRPASKLAAAKQHSPPKQTFAQLAKKCDLRSDARNSASMTKGPVRQIQTRTSFREPIGRRPVIAPAPAIANSRLTAARTVIIARPPQKRYSHEDKTVNRRPSSPGRSRRRSSSRSPPRTENRSRNYSRRIEASRLKQSALSRRSAADLCARLVLSAKPKAPLLKQPRRLPSPEQKRKRPMTLESRGRARTPPSRGRPRTPPPRHHSSGRQQHQRAFGHGSGAKGRDGGVYQDDLHRLTEVLRIHVGLDYGRELTEEDLDGLRAALPPGTLDDLLELLRRAPTMSFHNFFAERQAANVMPPPDWSVAGNIGEVGRDGRNLDYLEMGNRADEGERKSRRASFGGHAYEAQHRRRSDNDHGHREYDGRKGRSSNAHSSMRVPLRRTPPGMDDQSRMFSMSTATGGSGIPINISAFDVVQTYENPNSSGSVMSGVVYAQPLPQHVSEMGGIYGRLQGQDSSGVAYGMPLQGGDSGVFVPVAPQATSSPNECWYQQPPHHHRRGNNQDGARRW